MQGIPVSHQGGGGEWGGSAGSARTIQMLGHPCEISHPLCPPPLSWIQVKLDFNLHNVSHLEGLGEGENRRVKNEEGDR